MVQPRKKTINKSPLKDRRAKNAEAQTWKQQLGSFGDRARLHGHELPSRPRPRQECNNSAVIRTLILEGGGHINGAFLQYFSERLAVAGEEMDMLSIECEPD
jgi:hypothetical protein